MMNSLVGINEIAARIERLKNSLKKEIRVSEDDVPEAVLAEIKQICNDCLIYHINRKGAECGYKLYPVACISNSVSNS